MSGRDGQQAAKCGLWTRRSGGQLAYIQVLIEAMHPNEAPGEKRAREERGLRIEAQRTAALEGKAKEGTQEENQGQQAQRYPGDRRVSNHRSRRWSWVHCVPRLTRSQTPAQKQAPAICPTKSLSQLSLGSAMTARPRFRSLRKQREPRKSRHCTETTQVLHV